MFTYCLKCKKDTASVDSKMLKTKTSTILAKICDKP